MIEEALRGLYPIIDTERCARTGVRPEELAEVIAAARVRIAQFRHKGPYTREIFAQAEAIGRIVRAGGVRYVINDRADVAMMLGADGVHLGQQDLPPGRVRVMVGSSAWIGYSTHNREQLEAGEREPADYLAFGPIFPTGSKDRPDPVVGIDGLAAARKLTRRPLVAIGGITRTNVGSAIEAGADAVAVISDLLAGGGRRALEERLKEWLILTQPRNGPTKG